MIATTFIYNETTKARYFFILRMIATTFIYNETTKARYFFILRMIATTFIYNETTKARYFRADQKSDILIMSLLDPLVIWCLEI